MNRDVPSSCGSMLISDLYRLDETTGRVVVDSSPGHRLLPVGLAGGLHILLFSALFLISNARGDLHLPQKEEAKEVAFMVETIVESPPPPAPVAPAPPEAPEVTDTTEPPPPEEEAEVIEQTKEEEPPEPVRNEQKQIPPPPRPRVQVSQVQIKPDRPRPVPAKPQPTTAVKTVAMAATEPQASKPHKTKVQTGFIKPVYPAYLNNPAPRYPRSAKRRRLEGVVELKVTVDIEGHVAALSLFKSCGHTSLDRAALQTVRHWRFLPAKRNGKKVISDVIVPIRFKLNS